MSESASCREAFTETLTALAKENPDIFAVTSDARGSAALTGFARELPEQLIEIGIAEQNEVGIAAGLAAVGKRPYICAPASFLSARSLEQIKIDVAYSQTNVKIFGVSGGISYGALGASHHSLHDIAGMRAIPGLNVIIPSTANLTRAMLRAIERTNEPVYIRVGKAALPELYPEEAPFILGKANMLADGKDLTIIACGETVAAAADAVRLLEAEGIHARLLDMHTLKPLDKDAILQAAKETGRILTVEEHHINGGLGAAVAQITAATFPVPVYTLALPDETLVAGNSKELFRHYGLDTQGIVAAAKKLMNGGV